MFQAMDYLVSTKLNATMNKLLSLSFSVLIASCLTAQPTITPVGTSIGDTFITVSDEGIEYDPGPSGANQNYDFSSVEVLGAFTFEYTAIDPSSIDKGALFPQSTSAWVTEFFGDQLINFFDFSGNEWVEYGVFGGAGGFTLVTHYDDPLTLLDGPLNYGDTGSDSYSGTISTNGLETTITGTSEYTIDGYGSLTLPFATLNNVLRVSNSVEEVQDLGFGFTAESVESEYLYFAQGYSLPIIYYVESESFFNGVSEGMEYSLTLVIQFNEQPLSIYEDSSESLGLFPNPAHSQIFLDSEAQLVAARLYDLRGGLVVSFQILGNQPLDISTIPNGTYILEAIDRTGMLSRQKVVVAK